jgi:uncharacterized protein
LFLSKDYSKALHWFTQTANQGDSDAQFSLALMYEDGKGTPKDYSKALHWYTQAANKGHSLAQNNLALMYKRGEGTPKNYILAYKHILIAGTLGYDTKKVIEIIEPIRKNGLTQPRN